MGNNQCCEEAKDHEYVSQVVEEKVLLTKVPPQDQNAHQKLPEELLDSKKSESNKEEEKIHQNHNHHIEIDAKPNLVQVPHPYPDPIQNQPQEAVEIPQLKGFVKDKVEAENYFSYKHSADFIVKKFGNDIYEGQLDNNGKYPQGFGKMYKSNGSLYLGHFQKGRAEGEGVFLMPDGLIYQGHFHNNHAQGKGKYECDGIVYEGNFLKSKFHGVGQQTSKQYEFEGEYYEGNKTHGIFKWKDGKKQEYIYTGHFNFKNQFHGEGILGQPNGIYSGSFIDGHKFGKGTYKYNTGLRYEGDYVKGLKQGRGVIYNNNNSIAYDGQFSNDLPHGRGFIYDGTGARHSRFWENGIDSILL